MLIQLGRAGSRVKVESFRQPVELATLTRHGFVTGCKAAGVSLHEPNGTGQPFKDWQRMTDVDDDPSWSVGKV